MEKPTIIIIASFSSENFLNIYEDISPDELVVLFIDDYLLNVTRVQMTKCSLKKKIKTLKSPKMIA